MKKEKLETLFNKYIFWGSLAGILMMMLMWLALLFPENNPIIDEHIIYALVFAIFATQSRNNLK